MKYRDEEDRLSAQDDARDADDPPDICQACGCDLRMVEAELGDTCERCLRAEDLPFDLTDEDEPTETWHKVNS